MRTKPQSDVELAFRRAGKYLYVIAVKRGGSTMLVEFLGLPKRQNGAPLTKGEVLFEYVQRPLPLPQRPDRQVPRPIKVGAAASATGSARTTCTSTASTSPEETDNAATPTPGP